MLDLAQQAHGQIIDFWKFFVPSALVLLGWIFSRKEPWPLTQRVAVAIAYIGFAVFNVLGLVGSYELLGTLVDELEKSKAMGDLTEGAFTAVVSRLDMGEWRLGIAFHFVVDLIVLYFILVWAGRKHTP